MPATFPVFVTIPKKFNIPSLNFKKCVNFRFIAHFKHLSNMSWTNHKIIANSFVAILFIGKASKSQLEANYLVTMATLFQIICFFALKAIKQLSYAKRMDIHKLFPKNLKVVEYHLNLTDSRQSENPIWVLHNVPSTPNISSQIALSLYV